MTTMKKNKFPKDWHGPMKAAAALLRRHGAKKVRWNSQIVKEMMVWGLQQILFYKTTYKINDTNKRKHSRRG